jgi:UDP-N-acetylmuramate dehydrogenase
VDLGARPAEPLADHTTLGLGGPAAWIVDATDAASVLEVLRWADRERMPVLILGGGSNVVVSDRGVAGVVVRITSRGIGARRDGADVLVEVAAGEPWDPLVERVVTEGWAGLECLAGIPGTVGATPIQNVGAYGQEVADVVESVTVLDRETLVVRRMAARECGFGYRTSVFRRHPERAVVLGVTYRLREGGAPAVRYRELADLVARLSAPPGLDDVRTAVLELRRAKSMVLDERDANRRSVGSFFVNPQLDPDDAMRVVRRAVELGVATSPDEVPRFPAADGRVKIPAAWLIEAAGFRKGMRRGAVGLSSAHALALVHHGGGTTGDLMALAGDIRRTVRDLFGVTLQPEPVLWGFEVEDPLEGQSAL